MTEDTAPWVHPALLARQFLDGKDQAHPDGQGDFEYNTSPLLDLERLEGISGLSVSVS
jgi:hypothetical protein